MKFTIYNDQLNPKFWNEDLKFNEEVRQSLLKIAKDFYKGTELDAPIKDIILIGSSANYNWSKYSDLDTHILIDFKDLDAGKYNKELVDLFKYKWNETHDITLQGHNVEVYIQDVNEPNAAEASFSILNNKWIKPPVKHKINVDKNLIKLKYNDIKNRIDRLDNDKCDNPDQCSNIATDLMEDIRRMRQAGLDKGGEFSTENLVFKLLRNTNYLEKLSNLKTSFYDKQFKESITQ